MREWCKLKTVPARPLGRLTWNDSTSVQVLTFPHDFYLSWTIGQSVFSNPAVSQKVFWDMSDTLLYFGKVTDRWPGRLKLMHMHTCPQSWKKNPASAFMHPPHHAFQFFTLLTTFLDIKWCYGMMSHDATPLAKILYNHGHSKQQTLEIMTFDLWPWPTKLSKILWNSIPVPNFVTIS